MNPLLSPFAVFSLLPALALVTAAVRSDDAGQQGHDLPEEVRVTEEAHDLGKSYLKDFDRVGHAPLRKDMAAADTTRALAAAWELCRRTPDERVTPRPPWFLGFFEGRTKLTPPLWWQFAVHLACFAGRPGYESLAAAALPNYVPLCPQVRKGPSGSPFICFPQAHDTGLELRAPTGTEVASEKDTVAIRVGERTLRLRGKNVKELRDLAFGNDTIETCVTKDRSFVAFVDKFADPYVLACVDTRSGKVLWRTWVWGLGNYGGYTGSWTHNVQIVSDNRVVAVYGECVLECYAEAFDVETGKSLFRFTSCLWRQRWLHGAPV